MEMFQGKGVSVLWNLKYTLCAGERAEGALGGHDARAAAGVVFCVCVL
jgi:hypothetical protein